MNRNEFDRRMDGRGPMQGGMISHNRGGYMNRGGYSNRGGQQRGGMQNRGGPPRGGQNRGRGGYSNNKGGQQQRSGSNQSSNITVTPNKNIINVKPEKPQTPQPTKEETKTPVKAENKTPVKNEKTTPQSQKTTPQAQTQKTPTQVQQRPQQRTTPTSNNSSNMRPPSAPKTQTTPTPQNARPQSQSPSPRSQNQSSRPQGQNPKPQSQNPRPQSQSPSPQTQTTQQTQQSVTKSQQNQGRSQIQAAQPPPDTVADEDEQPADNQVQQQNESRQQQYNSGRQQNYNQNRNQGQNQGNRDNRKGDRFSQPRRDRNEYRQSSYHNRDDDERPTPAPRDEKKFTMRCRLFVGNLTNEISDEEFKEMFEPFGELSEVYVNAQRGFGFVRLDYKANAEAAKAALDGTTRKGRTLRVRFASHGAALKVRNLSPFVSNELLESAFSQMGEVERAIVICDDRGKSTGEGVVEFARKQNAQNAIKRINDGAFILTASPRPIFVEPLEQKDDEDGVAEKFLPKNDQYRKEREVEPRFAPPGSFEFTFAAKWKQIVDMEKNQMEQVKRNVEEAKLKLEGEMENAQIEHQEELIRQDLMRQQDELRRLQELRQQAELRRRQESDMRMRQLEEEDRLRQEQQQRRQDMMRRQDMRPMGGDTHNMGQEDMMMGPSGMSSSGNRGNAPPLPPPPAPPASMGLDRNRSQMAGSYGNQGMGGPMGMGGDAGLGGMPMGNQGAQMSQFDTSSGNAFGSGNSYQTQGGMANMGGSSGPGNMYNQGGMTGNNQGLRGNDRGMDRRREGGSRDDYPNDMKRVRRF